MIKYHVFILHVIKHMDKETSLYHWNGGMLQLVEDILKSVTHIYVSLPTMYTLIEWLT